MPSPAWSAWRPLPLTPVFGNADVLAEILDGGQAFRWFRQPDDTWLGTWSNCIAQVRLTGGVLEWRAPHSLAESVANEIGNYFGASIDFASAIDALPWRSDPHLAHCLTTFPGLRMLHQPFGETLLAFLCSATKQIVQIKQMLALLAARHGTPIVPVAERAKRFDQDTKALAASATGFVHALPTWEQLAQIPESELRLCLLGFRARFIRETAQLLKAQPGWLDETEHLPYPDAKARLCTLPGVGEKIADCVLLYGGGRLESFPVDVWILRAMAKRYSLTGWKPAQVAHFGRTHFGAFAGLAQQYLFNFERSARKSSP